MPPNAPVRAALAKFTRDTPNVLTLFLVLLLLLGVLSGCASAPDRNPVPESNIVPVLVLGRDDLRLWADESMENILAGVARRYGPGGFAGTPAGAPGDRDFLALSGGAEDGAFGAGLLVGWTEAGDRPVFNLVTGVSAGALIAPFAFLGSDYDDALQQAFTSIDPDQIFVGRPLLSLFGASSVAEFRLEGVVRQYFDEAFLVQVALAHAQGRFLFVVTADLDAQRGVVWNMGAIASTGHPGALALFRKIIVASASVPGVFPPVPIRVTVDGKEHEEMHVDGGLASQVFAYPLGLQLDALEAKDAPRRVRRLYVIRNGRLSPSWQAVGTSVPAIVGRALLTLIKQQSKGDLYRIYLASGRDGVNFHLAHIPTSFVAQPDELFDPIYMRALFGFARDLARKRYVWDRSPPGWQEGGQ